MRIQAKLRGDPKRKFIRSSEEIRIENSDEAPRRSGEEIQTKPQKRFELKISPWYFLVALLLKSFRRQFAQRLNGEIRFSRNEMPGVLLRVFNCTENLN